MARLPREENRIPTIGAISSADSESLVILEANATTKSLNVHIMGDDVGIGGGTQYAVDAALGATPTGTLAIAIRDDALSTLTPVEGDAIGVRVDANGALWVIPSGTTTISGTVTANAGTNLNTSALALETTATSIKTAVETIDNAISGTEMQVDVLTMPSVTVTATNLDVRDLTATDVVTVTGGVGQTADVKITLDSESVAVTNAGLTSLNGAISGTEVQVDVLTMPSVTVTATNLDIRDLTAVDVVTANLSAVDNTVLDNIDADTSAIQTAVELVDDVVFTDDTSTHTTGTTKGVGIMAAATPTDGSVNANDIGMVAMSVDRRIHTDTQIVGQDVNLTVDLGTTDNAVLDAIEADTTTIAGAVAGTEMQVDVLTMPSVTVTATNLDIRDLTATDVVTVTGGVGQTADVKVTLDSESVAVTGTFWQATQPVSNAGTFAVQDSQDVMLGTDFSNVLGTGSLIDANSNINVNLRNGAQALNYGPDNADNVTVVTTNSQPKTLARLYGFDGVTWDRLPGDATAGLKVDLGADNDVTVTGSVTANAGTNLNTSALALETGGNLAGAATSLAVLDDWDETNRAAVNTIAGQVGVQGASGIATALTQRVVLATDVALPAGTNGIGKLTSNTGVDIGDVDVTSVVPGTAATSLGKAEDGGHTTGDVGVFALGVRNDTPNAALTTADLDYSPIATYRTGALRIAPPEEDFAVLGSNSVKKYYANTGAVTDGIVWSPAAGKRWYVTDIFVGISAAATITLEDDLTAGDSTVWAMDAAANSGWSHHFSTPLFSGEDAMDLIITTTAGNVKVMVVGYEI